MYAKVFLALDLYLLSRSLIGVEVDFFDNSKDSCVGCALNTS